MSAVNSATKIGIQCNSQESIYEYSSDKDIVVNDLGDFCGNDSCIFSPHRGDLWQDPTNENLRVQVGGQLELSESKF